MSRIINSLKMIPVIYKIKVSLKIEDYSGFNKEKVVDAFEDAIEMNHYSLERESRRKWIKTSLLVIVGIIVLFFNAYAKKSGWYGKDETNVDIASEVFDKLEPHTCMNWLFYCLIANFFIKYI